MSSIQKIVEDLQDLAPEDLIAVAGYVSALKEKQHKRLLDLTHEGAARLAPVKPDPPATGVWKKRSLVDTDDW